jgi:radical SAM superfamily enzyme YgiQ (UPF0313 family)|tara:strand:- start:524 stop:889 length:366 start_codon:yes stop_codon:yes gene_type:complete
LPDVSNVLKLIKTYKPKIKILIGGTHSTAVKEDIFQHIPLADYALFGEAEIGFENYLIQETSAEFTPEKTPNFIYRGHHGTVKLLKKNLRIIEMLISYLGGHMQRVIRLIGVMVLANCLQF